MFKTPPSTLTTQKIIGIHLQDINVVWGFCLYTLKECFFIIYHLGIIMHLLALNMNNMYIIVVLFKT